MFSVGGPPPFKMFRISFFRFTLVNFQDKCPAGRGTWFFCPRVTAPTRCDHKSSFWLVIPCAGAEASRYFECSVQNCSAKVWSWGTGDAVCAVSNCCSPEPDFQRSPSTEGLTPTDKSAHVFMAQRPKTLLSFVSPHCPSAFSSSSLPKTDSNSCQ